MVVLVAQLDCGTMSSQGFKYHGINKIDKMFSRKEEVKQKYFTFTLKIKITFAVLVLLLNLMSNALHRKERELRVPFMYLICRYSSGQDYWHP